MKTKEKAIIGDNSRWRNTLLKAMRRNGIDNPYESEKHKAAREYLEKRKIKIRPLRKEE